MSMPRQRLLLLSLALVGLAVVVAWALGRPRGAVRAVQEEQMAITLTPANLLLDPDGIVQLHVDAGGEGLGFARVELLFDPAVVALETVETTTLLATVTSSLPDEANATGRIVLALRAEAGTTVTGMVELASLHFVAAAGLPEQRTTVSVDPAHVQLVTRAGAEPVFTTGAAQVGVNPAPVTCLGITEIPSAECEGLRSFYSTTGGNEWGNWFTGDSPCRDWHGITCTGGHVTGLDLAVRGIGGNLPPVLAELSHLEVLNLAENEFGGDIPAELGALSALRSLDLHGNRLDGAIPAELSALANLQHLDLGYNMLTAPTLQVATFLDGKDPDWAQTQTVPPAGLEAAVGASSETTLGWEPIAYAAAGGFYEIYVAPATAGPYLFHGSSSATTTSRYTVDELEPNTTYFFKMRTYSPAGSEGKNELFSRYSEVVSATTPPPPPGGLTATTGSDADVIGLGWDAVPGANAYEIYRASSATGPKMKVARVTDTAFADTTAAAAKIYFYWLTTCNEIGCSEFSPMVYGWRQEIPALFGPVIYGRAD